MNPTRTGFLAVLERMGARIACNRRVVVGEPVAELQVEPAELVATEVRPEEVPTLVDELPLFALAAGMAHGDSVVTGGRGATRKGVGPCRERERCAAATGRAHRSSVRMASGSWGALPP